MSYIFRSQDAPVSKVDFQGFTPPDSKSFPNRLWLDNTSKDLQMNNLGQNGSIGSLVASVVIPVTATNPTSAANLMSFAPPAGFLNVVGKGLWFKAYGYAAPVSANTTVTISAYFGTVSTNVSVLSFLSSSTVTAASVTGWNLEGYIATASVGATGTLYSQANGQIFQGTGTTLTNFSTANTTATGAIDLSAATAETLQFQATIGSGNASSTVVQTALFVYTLN